MTLIAQITAASALIAAMDRRPDAIVLAGDMIDRCASGYGCALSLLRASSIPLLPMAGNYDRANDFHELLLAQNTSTF